MIFFTSDHHFGHANIIKYCKRPFATVEEMNEDLVARWNAVVNANDVVYYLGDFSLAQRSVELFAPRLNGEKYFIMGNHDICHPCHKKKAEAALSIYQGVGFKILGLESVMTIAGKDVRLHHMPYRPSDSVEADPYDSRQAKFRPEDDGLWLLHGHVHEKWREKDRMINVGVDVWDFYPVPITEIERILGS